MLKVTPSKRHSQKVPSEFKSSDFLLFQAANHMSEDIYFRRQSNIASFLLKSPLFQFDQHIVVRVIYLKHNSNYETHLDKKINGSP